MAGFIMELALDFKAWRDVSPREPQLMLGLMVTILGRSIGRESLLPAAMTNHYWSLITMGAGPLIGLDERPIFTRPQAVWHHRLRLRAHSEEQWAQRQKAHHAKQQARKKRSAASGHTLQPKQPAQRCPAKGGATRSEYHYATNFYAKPMLMPGEKRGRQFSALRIFKSSKSGSLHKSS